jgi:DNA-binding IclR family transcriptional regulator
VNVLEYVALHPGITVADASSALALGRATTYRLVDDLVQEGWIVSEGSPAQLRPTLRAAMIGLATVHENHARDVILSNAIVLAGEIGRTCLVSFHENGEVTYTDIVDVVAGRVRISAGVSKLPVACSASGKAFLAHMPDDQVQQIAARGLPPYTSNTRTTAPEILKEVELARERGFGYSEGEYTEGFAGIAVVVLDGNGRPAGALHVGARAPLPPGYPDDVVEPLRAAARQASMELGYRSPFRTGAS